LGRLKTTLGRGREGKFGGLKTPTKRKKGGTVVGKEEKREVRRGGG